VAQPVRLPESPPPRLNCSLLSSRIAPHRRRHVIGTAAPAFEKTVPGYFRLD